MFFNGMLVDVRGWVKLLTWTGFRAYA